MGEILGLGTTHKPLMMRPDDNWTWILKTILDDPDLPEEWKDQSKWPARLREELGNDFGHAAATRQREDLVREFAKTREALDEFNPDVVIIWGDDQYENFRMDLVPPFAVQAYEDMEIKPWDGGRANENQWGEGPETTFLIRGHRQAGKHLARGLIESGFDIPYAYEPLHEKKLAHAFLNTILFLDYDRTKPFDYPVVSFPVNSYGSRLSNTQGLRLPLSMHDGQPDPDPPGPTPKRCMEVGAAVARIMAESPYRTALIASASWSHSFLTEKHWQLWPDVDADFRMYRAMCDGDYDVWRSVSIDDIEDSGHHELLNWFCLVGAMEELERKPDYAYMVETMALVSNSAFVQCWPTPKAKREIHPVSADRQQAAE